MRPFRVPTRFQPATLKTLDVGQFEDVVAYAKTMRKRMAEGKGLLLSGKPGVGKTWAIVALTRKYVERVIDARYEFVTAPDMFENLGDFGERFDDYRQQPWTTTYQTIPWLVINDLGKEYKGGKLASQIPTQLGRVLRARSEATLVTHITTNLTAKNLATSYGDTVASLIHEMCEAVVVTGKDRRRAS